MMQCTCRVISFAFELFEREEFAGPGGSGSVRLVSPAMAFLVGQSGVLHARAT